VAAGGADSGAGPTGRGDRGPGAGVL